MKDKKLILLLHGFKANNQSLFFPYLKKTLSPYGKVLVPNLPDTANPCLTEWKEYIKNLTGDKNVDLVVGHSLGGVLAMSMVTTNEIRIVNLVTIASSPGWKDDEKLNNFLTPAISFNALKKRVKNMIVAHSFDDTHCAFEYGMILVKQAKAAGIFFGNKGHFLHKTLPKILMTQIIDLIN